MIKQLGHNPDRYKIADGCGLSNYDYLSPALLVDFLKFAYSRTEVFRKLYKALPRCRCRRDIEVPDEAE